MSNKEKKSSKKAKIIGNTIFFSILTIMVTFFVWNYIDIKSGYKYPIFGTRTSVIVSPSMAEVNPANTYITEDMQQIQQYDVVTTIGYNSFDEIQIYDVATYYTGEKNLVCHRVIDKYVDSATGIQYVVFRGDANAISDVPVSYDLVRGKVVSVTPQVGHVVAFLQSPYFFIAIFGVGFFVCLGLLIAGHKKDKKQVATQEPSNEIQEQKEPVEEQSAEQNNGQVEPVPVVENEENKPEEVPNEPEVVEPEAEEVPAEKAKEESVQEKAPAEEPLEQPTVEEQPEESKQEEKKPKKASSKKPAKAAPSKKVEPKEKPVEKKEVNFRTYHVNKRKEDGKWTVKYAGGEKVIKLFDTQKEALEFTKKMAENQGGTVLVHASKGAQKGKIKKK